MVEEAVKRSTHSKPRLQVCGRIWKTLCESWASCMAFLSSSRVCGFSRASDGLRRCLG